LLPAPSLLYPTHKQPFPSHITMLSYHIIWHHQMLDRNYTIHHDQLLLENALLNNYSKMLYEALPEFQTVLTTDSPIPSQYHHDNADNLRKHIALAGYLQYPSGVSTKPHF